MRDRIIGLKNIPVSKLRGFQGGNPKTYNVADRELLETSINNHGYVLPVAARDLGDGTFELIDGHHRVEVIVERDPNIKIKVLLLDVDSVADGRRILLALQHNAGYDLTKLEEFVTAAMGDGATAAELMADTGLTGSHLDAFASAGSEFLDSLANGGDSDEKAEGKGDGGDETNEGVSRKGLITEHVQFAVPLTREQSPVVHKAIKLAKQLTDKKVSGDALVEICNYYIEQHKE